MTFKELDLDIEGLKPVREYISESRMIFYAGDKEWVQFASFPRLPDRSIVFPTRSPGFQKGGLFVDDSGEPHIIGVRASCAYIWDPSFENRCTPIKVGTPGWMPVVTLLDAVDGVLSG